MKKRKIPENKTAVTPAEEQPQQKAVMEFRVQKAEIAAKTSYDYRRLEQKNPLMLSCEIEEEKETLFMKFDVADLMPIEQLNKENRIRKMEVLLQAAALESLYMQFEFTLQPDNLYYDRLGTVKVMRRDIVASVNNDRKQQFLNMYQALIGYIMEGSRPYGDYLSGGTQILKKKEEYVKLMEPKTLEEEKRLLIELYEDSQKKEKESTIRVDRRRYKTLKVYAGVSVVLLAGLAAACIYSFGWYMPQQNRVTAANNAYLQRDYIAVIDSLQDISIEDLDRSQKYILATAYIQGQSVDTFSVSDKEAILSKITYQANESVLDYWIYLGRLEVTEAEELAMQMSDNQLLLYAYMQELNQLDKNTTLPGEEKSARQEQLRQEIEELANNLGIEYGEPSVEDTENEDGTEIGAVSVTGGAAAVGNETEINEATDVGTTEGTEE